MSSNATNKPKARQDSKKKGVAKGSNSKEKEGQQQQPRRNNKKKKEEKKEEEVVAQPWVCGKCTNNNRPWRDACFRCNLSKEDSAKISMPNAVNQANANGKVSMNTNTNGEQGARGASASAEIDNNDKQTETDTNTDTEKEVGIAKEVKEAEPIVPVSLSSFRSRVFAAEAADSRGSKSPLPAAHAYVSAPRGLVNTGNTCYRSAVVQCLLSLPAFNRTLSRLLRGFRSRLEVPPKLWMWSELLATVYSLKMQHTHSLQPADTLSKRVSQHPAPPLDLRSSMPGVCNAFPPSFHVSSPGDGCWELCENLNNNGNNNGNNNNQEGQQQDAMEFLDFLLDSLHEEELSCLEESSSDKAGNGSVFGSIVALRQGTGEELDVDVDGGDDDYGWETSGKKGPKAVVDHVSRTRAATEAGATLVARTFHCRVQSVVFYKSTRHSSKPGAGRDLYSSSTYQRLHCLDLQISEGYFTNTDNNNNYRVNYDRGYSLEEALDSYFATDKLESASAGWGGRDGRDDKDRDRNSHNQNNHSPIKKGVEGSKTASEQRVCLDSLPNVLLLQLKRFTFDRHYGEAIKISRAVDYPARLKLKNHYLSSDLLTSLEEKAGFRAGTGEGAGDGVMADYRLSGLVMHHGSSANSGHYTSLCRLLDGNGEEWVHLDDTNVELVSQMQALGAEKDVYVLMYSRIE